jgi:hypothetical protein
MRAYPHPWSLIIAKGGFRWDSGILPGIKFYFKKNCSLHFTDRIYLHPKRIAKSYLLSAKNWLRQVGKGQAEGQAAEQDLGARSIVQEEADRLPSKGGFQLAPFSRLEHVCIGMVYQKGIPVGQGRFGHDGLDILRQP